jgi:hypothetical protein
MPNISPVITSFLAGEISPRLEGRTDLKRYAQGCRTIDNMIVHPHGGATRRYGTRYVAAVKHASKKTRLIPFEFSTEQAYILEVGDQYVRFFMDNGQVLGQDVTVENYGFETAGAGGADVFESWTESAGDGAIARDTTYVNENGASCKLTCGASNNTSVTQNITVVAETTHELRFHTRGDGSTAGRYGIYDIDNNTYIKNVASTTITGVEFEQRTFEFDTPSGCTTIRIEFYPGSTNGDIAYFDSVILKNMEEPYEVATDIVAADIFGIKYAQSADTMYVVHPDYPPVKLVRSAHDVWDAEDVDFQDGPYLPAEETTAGITPSGTSGSITLTADSPIFKSGHVNGLFRLRMTFTDWAATTAYTVGDVVKPTTENGYYYVCSTAGTSAGSEPTWDEEILTKTSDGSVVWTCHENGDDDHYRYFKITAFTSPTVVTATVKSTENLPNTTQTTSYQFGAWSEEQGYPSCVTFYEQRLVFAGNAEQPQRVYLSQSQDWENFRIGVNDSDACIYQIAADQVNPILWLVPGRYLYVGTAGGEWIMSSGSDDQAITPTLIRVRRETTYGSAGIQAKMVGQRALFVQRSGMKIREFGYKYVDDSFVSKDLTILAEHIIDLDTEATGGVDDWDYQSYPDSIMWVIVNGRLLGLTYDPEMEVYAWHQHPSITAGDTFLSVASIPVSSHDQLWLIASRNVDGSWVQYVEYMESKSYDQEDSFFVDSGLTYNADSYTIQGATQAAECALTITGHPYSTGDHIYIVTIGGMTELIGNTYLVEKIDANTVKIKDTGTSAYIDSTGYTAFSSNGSARLKAQTLSGLDHLEKEYVQCLTDGIHAETTLLRVSSGSITLTTRGMDVQVGLPYESVLEPMRLEPGAPSGSSVGKTRRIVGADIRFHQTLGGKVGADDGYEDDVDWESATTFQNKSVYVGWPGGYDEDSYIRIVQDKPYPMSVLSIAPLVDMSDD